MKYLKLISNTVLVIFFSCALGGATNKVTPKEGQDNTLPSASAAQGDAIDTAAAQKDAVEVNKEEKKTKKKKTAKEDIDRDDAQTLPPLPNEQPALQNNLRDAKDEPAVILTDENRLMHPWAAAAPAELGDLKPVPWFGERLKFKIAWSFIVAGEAELNFSKLVDIDGQKSYAVESLAKSYSAIDAVFKVRDINMSWLTAEGLRSLGYWQSVREGKYSRDEWIKFNYQNNTYETYKRDKQGKITAWDNAFKGPSVFDMLSSLYYVRTMPLALNTTVFFDIVNRNRQYPLKVEVLRKETVKVKAGKFDCIVVEPMISGEGIFVSKGKSLKVWLTDDEYKMPVKMTVEVFIGSVSAELSEYSGPRKQ